MRNLTRQIPPFLVLVMCVSTASAWDREEHQTLADSVFAAVIRDCASSSDSAGFTLAAPEDTVLIARTAWSGSTFGERAARHAADDFASDRFHRRGRTIADQLAEATTSLPGRTRRQPNVAAAFLAGHLQALHLAAQAPDADTDKKQILLWALEQEAQAEGYLADAFAAGHILSYREGLFTMFARRNRIEAHDFHRDRGVYVINGRGEVWQTFGDGLLHWYPPTYQAAFDACAASLREVLVVWYLSQGLTLPEKLSAWLAQAAPDLPPRETRARWLSDRSGRDFYAEIRLPSLLYLPMPVAAAWSFRTDTLDQHGVRLRQFFPQLREPALHDPDERDIDADFLYARASVPEWMIPAPLRSGSIDSTRKLIKTDPEWASVRYSQERTAPPSYKGLLIMAGGQITISEGKGRTGGAVGLGYGFYDDLLLVKNVSIAATYLPSFHEADDRLLTLTAGLAVDLPGNGWPKALRLEGGGAAGLGDDFNDYGPVFAIGFDSQVIPLGFTYAGVSGRVQYQWFSLDRPVSGPSVTLVFQ